MAAHRAGLDRDIGARRRRHRLGRRDASELVLKGLKDIPALGHPWPAGPATPADTARSAPGIRAPRRTALRHRDRHQCTSAPSPRPSTLFTGEPGAQYTASPPPRSSVAASGAPSVASAQKSISARSMRRASSSVACMPYTLFRCGPWRVVGGSHENRHLERERDPRPADRASGVHRTRTARRAVPAGDQGIDRPTSGLDL